MVEYSKVLNLKTGLDSEAAGIDSIKIDFLWNRNTERFNEARNSEKTWIIRKEIHWF